MDRFETQKKIEKVFEKNQDKEELKKNMLNVYSEYAKSQKIKLNENKKIVEAILEGLIRNKEKHGKSYCPCRIVTGNKEEDEKKVCPCFWHMDEIKNMKHCHCNLFTEGKK
ncbi:MAG: ferredoxin-thioredoxin reductase catalytic domain-containing protein [Candidatus Aenigmarchaeota archaeon]|nr:ferredoxin-thioredoxin reductase catalytic domain-containing protein [Candidatus Aenigmarchaeota archaeon]